jgi:hypothetical protein
MKADERKHLKENELASKLSHTWQALASGSTTNTIIWGVILLGLVLAVGWRYYSDASYRSNSALWSQLAIASDNNALRQIINEYPGKPATRIARYHLARSLMQESRGRLAGPNAADRKDAADDLVKARDLYAELARERSDEPTLTQEALMGVAKAEEILASVPKADNDIGVRGSLDEAIKAYEQVATKYPNSFYGEQASKRAKELRDDRSQVEAFYAALAKENAKLAVPPLPPQLPTAPLIPPLLEPILPELPKAGEGKAGDAPPTPTVVPALPPGGAPKDAPKGEPKTEPKSGGGEPKR